MARARTTAIVGGDTVGLDQAMLRCRTYGHAWDEFFPIDKGAPSFGWRLSLRCGRCTAERHDLIDWNGAVGARQYEYPEGYRLPREEALNRDAFRQTMYERIRAKLAKAGAVSSAREAS